MSDKLRRLKELLVKNITDSSQVFIIGHTNPDYDCIGAAIGVSKLAQTLKKESYIIVNDLAREIDPGVKKVIDDSKDSHNIITAEEYRNLVDENSLIIALDVNKSYLIAIHEDINKAGKVMIIDHHSEDEDTIPANYKFIDTKISSTCEMIAQVLNSKQVKYGKDLANYLLAGIILDTKRFQKNTSATTLATAQKLYTKGADYDAVNKLFLSNYVEDKLLYSLIFGEEIRISKKDGKDVEMIISNTHIQAYPQILGEPTVSFTVNRANPGIQYRQVDLAKTADKMLKYADMSFVFGYISPTNVGISARSKCEINVGNILGRIKEANFPLFNQKEIPKESNPIKSGGGNKENAAGVITTDDIFCVEKTIMDFVLELSITKEETKSETPVVLIKKAKEVKGQ